MSDSIWNYVTSDEEFVRYLPTMIRSHISASDSSSNRVNRDEALSYLNLLLNQPLRDARKFFDTELYIFGFGETVKELDIHGKESNVAMYRLHAQCRFKVIWKNGIKRAGICYEDTPNDEFKEIVHPLLNRKVVRVGLSDKNDLWLDFKDYWVVFATFENDEESWRFFEYHKKQHLVATDKVLELEGGQGD